MHTNLTVPTNLGPQLAAALEAGHTPSALGHYRLLDAQYGTDLDADVDFATLFLVPECTAPLSEQLSDGFICDEACCNAPTLTPRQAYAMHNAAVTFLEFAAPLEPWGSPDEWYLAENLPPVCGPYVHDPVWMTQLRHVFHVLAGRLAAGQIPYPRSTAEEMALHLVLDVAQDWTDDAMFDDRPEYADLPLLAADLAGFHDIREWAFEDEDVLMLFDRSLDGMETSPLATVLGMSNLHPTQWFMPFRDGDEVEADLVLPSTEDATAQVGPTTVRLSMLANFVIDDPRQLLQAAVAAGFVSSLEGYEDVDLLGALDTLPDSVLQDVCAEAVLHLTEPLAIPGTTCPTTSATVW